MDEILQSPGRLRIHDGDQHFNDLSAIDRAKYGVSDASQSDPFSSSDNVDEHHPL